MEMVTLVDGLNCLVNYDGKINAELADFLDKQHRRVIVVTDTTNEKIKNNLKEHGFEISQNSDMPKKNKSEYFKKLLQQEKLSPENVFYFDHKRENLGSAMKAGITHLCFWDGNLENIKKKFSGYNF